MWDTVICNSRYNIEELNLAKLLSVSAAHNLTTLAGDSDQCKLVVGGY